MLNDYHLVAGASSALNLADSGTAPALDVDSQTRQTTATATTTVICDSTIAGCNSTFEAPVVAGDSTTDPNSWISNAVGAQTGTSRLFVDTGLQSAWTSPTGFQTQTFGAVEPNTTYTLTVRVGRRGGAGAPTYGGYTVGLYAATTATSCNNILGATQLQVATSSSSPASAGWTTVTVAYTSGGAPSGFLCVRLANGVLLPLTARTYFDNVTLSKSVTTAANPADRGADEFWVTPGGYVPGTTLTNNLGNVAPTIGPFANQNALSFTVFKATVPATDANGDRLQFRLCTSGTGNCTAPTIPGLLIDSATGQIQWTTPNWTSGAITLPGCTGTGNSRTCALRAQVSDNAFPSLACPTSNCASLNFTITLRRYDGSGPIANNDP